MSMKHVKELVDQFSTRVFQDGQMTFGEIRQDNKVLTTIGQDSDLHKIYSWAGKSHNRQGKLKECDRSTSWNKLCEIDFKVELERKLLQAVARTLNEEAQSIF